MGFVYQVLIRLVAPLVLLATAVRGLRDRSYWDRLPERLGYTRVRFEDQPIWVHAVSVGEVQAAAPLIRRLLAQVPARPILITTTTPTGAARVRALFADVSPTRWQHAFLPYDTPGAIRRSVTRLRPHSLIIMETELWPNLLLHCAQQGIPVVVASARISLRTADRYRRLRALFAPSMHHLHIAAQSQADAERFLSLGALPQQTEVIGNIKFDMEPEQRLVDEGQQLRSHWAGRAVWIAGSTHAGEEEQILAAHQQVLPQHPNSLLIIAPRHPQRFAAVAQLLKQSNLRFVTRSSQEPVRSDTQVLLLDSLGELNLFYAASDVVFVGGSLVPVGGHNLLEPAALSRAIVTGPHVFNAPDIAARLAERDALRYVYSAEELANTVGELCSDEAARRQLGHAAYQVLADNRGAMQRLLSLLAEQHAL